MLRHADGIDHYGDAASLLRVYPDGGSLALGPADYARTGNGCFLSSQSGIGSSRLPYHLPVPQHKVGVQFSTYIPRYVASDGGVAFQGVQFIDPASPGLDDFNVAVHFDYDGSMVIYGNRYTYIYYRSPPGLLMVGSHQYWQVCVDVQPANIVPGGIETGSIEVRLGEGINASTIVLIAGVKTAWGGTAITGTVALGRYFANPRTAFPVYYDDYIVWDTTGTKDNDFMQSRRCRTVFLTADDILQQWAVTGGETPHATLSHIPALPTTHYLSSDTVGESAQFSMGDVPTSAIDMAAARVVMLARTDDPGGASISASLVNGADSVESAPALLTTNDAYYSCTISTNPDGTRLTPKTFNLSSVKLNRTA